MTAPHADSSRQSKALRGSQRNVIVMVPVLLVLITFLFWYQTWFGRPLSDQEMSQVLADTSVPHKTQHAVAQLADRMARGDTTVKRWYPQLLALAQNKEPQLRMEAAWAMGQDNQAEEFHSELRKLLLDPAPLVRSNAALALVRFGDASGEPQLVSMLQAFTVTSPTAGAIHFRMNERDDVRNGSIIARIAVPNAAQRDVVSPVGGTIARRLATDASNVALNQPIAAIDPDEGQAMEALRALYLVGEPRDLEVVERYARGVANMSDRVRTQAESAVRAIRERSKTDARR